VPPVAPETRLLATMTAFRRVRIAQMAQMASTSAGQVTTVDRVIGTRRGRRPVAGQPGQQLGDLLRLTESLERVL
jgi:hypothetical protein